MKHNIIISTCTIFHPYPKVSDIYYCIHSQGYMQFKKAHQYVQRQQICIEDEDHDYILCEIERHDHIEYETKIYNYDK